MYGAGGPGDPAGRYLRLFPLSSVIGGGGSGGLVGVSLGAVLGKLFEDPRTYCGNEKIELMLLFGAVGLFLGVVLTAAVFAIRRDAEETHEAR